MHWGARSHRATKGCNLEANTGRWCQRQCSSLLEPHGYSHTLNSLGSLNPGWVLPRLTVRSLTYGSPPVEGRPSGPGQPSPASQDTTQGPLLSGSPTTVCIPPTPPGIHVLGTAPADMGPHPLTKGSLPAEVAAGPQTKRRLS